MVVIAGQAQDNCAEMAREVAGQIADAWPTRQGDDAHAAWDLIVLRCEFASVPFPHYPCVAEQLWLNHGLPDTGEVPDTWAGWEDYVRQSVAHLRRKAEEQPRRSST